MRKNVTVLNIVGIVRNDPYGLIKEVNMFSKFKSAEENCGLRVDRAGFIPLLLVECTSLFYFILFYLI